MPPHPTSTALSLFAISRIAPDQGISPGSRIVEAAHHTPAGRHAQGRQAHASGILFLRPPSNSDGTLEPGENVCDH
jgi:hypothetical protein